ncbi:MAG: adenylate/guanylate cyclase domain-containing protein [Anaerolineae bacterium]|nr:adenylate/guanylate cyclase domain-containing protein [Anaerolineae bacterium]
MSSPVPPNNPLPRGTVTLLFTDIEGSTRHLERLGALYAQALADHHRLLRAAFAAHEGYEMGTEGDAFFVVFDRAGDAIAAAAAAQYALDQHLWPGGQKLRVRMGLHTGEPASVEGHYIGMDVHRAARISQAGHGGQVLLSQTTYALGAAGLPRGVKVRDLGAHRLKDLQGVQRLYQLVLDGLPDQFPPLRTLDAYPHNLPLQLTPLFGREADVARLRALLEQPSVRLVTLTGPGGVGKTRLSLQVAADAMELFPDGVFFVPLAALTEPALVLQAIAQALGVAESERRLVDSLKDFLATREMLIILDNFEQLLAAAPHVSELLRVGRGLKTLVTGARQIQGEHELPITPSNSRIGPGTWRLRSPDYALRNMKPSAIRPPFNSSLNAPRRSGPTSPCPRPTPTRLRASANAWTACLWQSSWRRPAPGCAPRLRFWPNSNAPSTSSPAGAATVRTASRPCAKRLTGARGCWMSQPRPCSAGWRSLSKAGRWKPAMRSACLSQRTLTASTRWTPSSAPAWCGPTPCRAKRAIPCSRPSGSLRGNACTPAVKATAWRGGTPSISWPWPKRRFLTTKVRTRASGWTAWRPS